MSEKMNSRAWTVREQILRDPATGLTITFAIDDLGRPRLRLHGDCLPFGNREIGFGTDGLEAFAGTSAAPCPTPSWIRGPLEPGSAKRQPTRSLHLGKRP